MTSCRTTQERFCLMPFFFKILNIMNENPSHTHGFKVNVPMLIKEITDCGLRRNSGILIKPINIFRKYLESVAGRCAELNDPVLNKLMVEMSLYEEADAYSEEYNEELIKQVEINYKEYLEKGKKN